MYSADNFDNVINLAIDGENRVLAHLQEIERLGKKASDQLRRNFTQASTQASRAVKPLEQAVNQVQRQIAVGNAKLGRTITQPIVNSYRQAFRLSERLARETKTGQAIAASIERVKPRIQKSILDPMRAAMDRAKAVVREGMADVRSQLGRPGGRQGPAFDPAQLAGLAGDLGGNFRQAQRAANIGSRAGLNPKQLSQAIARTKELQGLGVPLQKQQDIIQRELGVTIKQFEAASKAAKKFDSGGGGPVGGGGGRGLPFSGLLGGITGVGLALGAVVAGFAAAGLAGVSFFRQAISMNEQLNQEILGSAANLAATSRVFQDGIEIINPTEKIQELQGPLRNALKQIAEDSIQLVGVTSAELTGVFATLNSQAAQLTGQSREFTNAIDAAGKLTIDFSAALGTIGLPLNQAGQEIRSILMGQVDVNSTLAKQLGITNEMVKRWKSQGVLVDELRKRLQPFVEGNALAAKSIGGVSSNIRDVIEIIQRELGEPILEPVVEALEWIYEKLDENREAIQSWLRPFINQAVEAGRLIAQELVPYIEEAGLTIEAMQPFLLDLFKVVTMSVVGLVRVLGPLYATVQSFVKGFGEVYDRVKQILAILPGFDDAGAGIEALVVGTQRLTEEQQRLVTQYEHLYEKRREGIALTDEELALEQNLKNQAAGAIEAIDEQIAAYERMIQGHTGHAAEIDASIKQLEMLKEAYSTAGLEMEFGLTGAEIQEIGNEFEQLTRQAQDARDQLLQFTEQGGQSAELQATAAALVTATQEQIKAGLITPQQAAEQLRLISENNKIEVKTRQQAQDAITQINQTASQRQVDALADQIRDQQHLIDMGEVGQVEGAQRLTKLKQDQLNVQLEHVRTAIKIENQLREAQVAEQVAGLNAELESLEGELAAASTGAERKAVEAQMAQVEAQRAGAQQSLALQSEKQAALAKQEAELQDQMRDTAVEGEKAVRAAQIKEIQQTTSRVKDEIDMARKQRELALQQEVNADPTMSSRERADRERAIQRETLEAQYQAEVEHRERLEALPLPNNPDEREAAEAEIRQSIQKTADLAIQLAKMEEEEHKLAIEREQTRIQRATEARLNGIQAERMALEQALESYARLGQQMEMQLDLIDQQIAARENYNATTQSFYSIAARFTKDEEERRKLEEEAAKVKIQQLREEHELEELQLRLKHQQTEALLEQEIIQARINQAQAAAAVAQAQADYAEAAADPSTRPEQLNALRLGIEAANMQAGAADSQFAFALQGRRNFERQREREIDQLYNNQGLEQFSAEADLAGITETERDDRRIARQASRYARNRERDRRQNTGMYDGNIEQLASEFQNFGARLAEFTVSPVPSTAPSTGLPSPQAQLGETSQSGQTQAMEGGDKIVHFNPVFHNTFGASEPGRQAVQEFEQGTLNTLKQVLDLV